MDVSRVLLASEDAVVPLDWLDSALHLTQSKLYIYIAVIIINKRIRVASVPFNRHPFLNAISSNKMEQRYERMPVAINYTPIYILYCI